MNNTAKDCPAGSRHSGNVLAFHMREARAELARLNRLTGLQFDSLPASLLSTGTIAETGNVPEGTGVIAIRQGEPRQRPAR